jgi:sporulation protein YunB
MGKIFRRRKIIVFFVLTLFLCVLISLFINNVVYGVITEYAEVKVREMTVAAVNKAVLDAVSGDLTYDDIVSVTKDGGGNVTVMQANTILINKIAQDVAKQAVKEFESIGEQTLEIPIGSLSGSPLFTGLGPPVCVKILSASSVICRFKSEFDSAGINQTRHKIYIEAAADMNIVLPAASKNVECVVEIYIAEAVLVGDVPRTFLNIGSFSFVP